MCEEAFNYLIYSAEFQCVTDHKPTMLSFVQVTQAFYKSEYYFCSSFLLTLT